MGSALKLLPGPEATGLSAKTISRLKSQWAAEYADWRKTDLGRDEWVYVWADGKYNGLRGTDDRLCVLVVIGVNSRGGKHFLAIDDGARESTQSWREVLFSLKAWGPPNACSGTAMNCWHSMISRPNIDRAYGPQIQSRVPPRSAIARSAPRAV